MRNEIIFKTRRRNALIFILGILLLVWGAPYFQDGNQDSNDSNSISLESPTKLPEHSLKTELEYSVINKEVSLPFKVAFDVRIPQKYSKLQLKEISRGLISESQNANRVFVVYYLPGMKVDAGAWATAHKGEEIKIMDFMLESNPTTLSN